MTKIAKYGQALRTLKEIKERPVGFVVDLILAAIVSALVPIPFAGTVVTRYKKYIIAGIIGALLLLFIIPFVIIGVLTNIFSTPQSTQTAIQKGLQGSQLLQALEGYIEAGFTDTDIPSRNPLGGNGMENSIVTMDYHDPNYMFFDHIHTGIDLVPSSNYYSTNLAYRKTGQLIVFATMNGKSTYYVDQYGANVVDTYNSGNTMFTRYVHLATSFISTGEMVKAGQPVGIMGQTGEATGVHLHYELRVNQGGTFVTVNPRDYIN